MRTVSHRDAVIVEAVRTPIGRRDRALASVRPDDLAALVLREVIRRAGILPVEVEDIIVGCATPVGEQGYNVGRIATLIADFPVEVPAVTINRMCASSDQAVQFASQAIRAGDMDVVMAAGIESMTRVPMGSDGAPFSQSLPRRYRLIPQGLSAELMVEKWGLSREELDAYSLESHRRAVAAWEAGCFRNEIVPVPVELPDGRTALLDRDEGPRADTSPELLASLPPVFKADGKITAGNSSQMSDGAAAVLLMSREKAERMGLRPRARIVATATIGSDPELQLAGPIAATAKVLERAGIVLDDLDHIEVNEAFASVVLAWAREWKPDLRRLNPKGGAIAIGHPLGATGARLLTTMLHALEESGGTYGLQTMCIGHGLANATIIARES